MARTLYTVFNFYADRHTQTNTAKNKTYSDTADTQVIIIIIIIIVIIIILLTMFMVLSS